MMFIVFAYFNTDLCRIDRFYAIKIKVHDLKQELIATKRMLNFLSNVSQDGDQFFSKGFLENIDLPLGVNGDAFYMEIASKFFPRTVFFINDSNFLWRNTV